MMKKGFLLLLALCLCLCLTAFAETTAPTLSYASKELSLPAAGLMLSVPSEMSTLESDEEAYDLGFRFNCFTDTFDMTVWVHDSRDMNLKDYAAFFADRYGLTAAPDTVNGFDVQLLTDTAKPNVYDILVAGPDNPQPDVVYLLEFSCTTESDVKLAEEILGTMALYQIE